MLKDLLRRFSKTPPSAPADRPEPAASRSKASIKPKDDKFFNRDRLVFIGLVIVVFAVYNLFDWLNRRTIDPNAAESVIPLAELTGKIGAQPKNETSEQQFRRENKNVPLSDGSTIPADIVKDRTQLFRQVPFGDEELAYEMRLPTNWGQSRFNQYGSPGPDRYKVLTNIDRFFGPVLEDKRPFAWLEVEHISRLTSAEQYMDQYMIQRGITPEAVKINGMQRAEALFIQVRDYSTYVIRAAFIINGDRMILVTFGVPIEEYKNYRDLMGLTLNSFHMLHAIERQPEEISNYKLLNVLAFDYPARWLPRSENRTSSLKPSVEFILPTELRVRTPEGETTENQIDGLILVNAWRKTPTFNRGVLEEAIVQRLQTSRIKLQSVLQPEKELPSHDTIQSVRQMIYIGQIDDTVPTTEEFGLIQNTSSLAQQEIWVTILDNSDYTTAVTLITWPQTKNYQNWAYNVASYQEILDTFRLRTSIY